jgi:hypothetical protein
MSLAFYCNQYYRCYKMCGVVNLAIKHSSLAHSNLRFVYTRDKNNRLLKPYSKKSFRTIIEILWVLICFALIPRLSCTWQLCLELFPAKF